MESDIVARSAPTGKRRIPKACSSCRQSKVKCDAQKPCSRCKSMGKQCTFFEQPKDPNAERLENLEVEVRHLNGQLTEIQRTLRGSRSMATDMPPPAAPQPHGPALGLDMGHSSAENVYNRSLMQPDPSISTTARGGSGGTDHSNVSPSAPGHVSVESLLRHPSGTLSSTKRPHSQFELQDEPISDIIMKGLVPADRAMFFFHTFFQGCDRFIPVFDPPRDTFDSIRSRSSILLNAICTIGCRISSEPGSQTADLLNAELKRSLNVVILDPKVNCLESVQAMLVVACYSAERSLVLSFATRMALDLKLPDAYEELIEKISLEGTEPTSRHPGSHEEELEKPSLMQKSRTWFGLLVLEHIFRVDAGKLPGIRSKGDTRRCRILLDHPSSIALDLRLLSQVELNVLRAKMNDTLSASAGISGGMDVVKFVRDAKIDIGLWFRDWSRIAESSTTAGNERPFLIVNLRVQRCWAEMMVQCKAMRYLGMENVAVMSPTEREILLMAKTSAKNHLKLITADPEHYLSTFKYAMDFVWAKCAFCFLLLLKLSQLLPEGEQDSLELLQRGEQLLQELSMAVSNGTGGSGNNIYFQILKLSIEKYRKAHREQESEPGASENASMGPFWELFNAQTDLQSFVPEQFTFEWDFPGLNLFYVPTAWQDFFSDLEFGI